jgi:hypothetical protein
MDEALKSMFKWLALNVGAKHPFLSTVGVMIFAALIWNWYFRSLSPEQTNVPTATNNKTSGPNSPIMPNNSGIVNIGQPPGKDQKDDTVPK